MKKIKTKFAGTKVINQKFAKFTGKFFKNEVARRKSVIRSGHRFKKDGCKGPALLVRNSYFIN